MLGQIIRDKDGRFIKGHKSLLKPAWCGSSVCPVCSKEIKKSSRNRFQVFCSRSCMSKDYKIRLKGKRAYAWKGGKIKSKCGFCGCNYVHYKSQRKVYCSNRCRQNGWIRRFGKGGISKVFKTKYWSARYRNWRGKVFVRDDYTCQECNRRGGRIEAHHIKSFAHYPRSRFILKNGMTLCHDCHKKTENYGARNRRY
jgi:5-methylcytosine-specific restriction endonuclease McrA